MDNISANIDAVVATDGAGGGVEGLGGTEHLSAGQDSVVAFPNHSTDGAGVHVLDQAGEETLG